MRLVKYRQIATLMVCLAMVACGCGLIPGTDNAGAASVPPYVGPTAPPNLGNELAAAQVNDRTNPNDPYSATGDVRYDASGRRVSGSGTNRFPYSPLPNPYLPVLDLIGSQVDPYQLALDPYSINFDQLDHSGTPYSPARSGGGQSPKGGGSSSGGYTPIVEITTTTALNVQTLSPECFQLFRVSQTGMFLLKGFSGSTDQRVALVQSFSGELAALAAVAPPKARVGLAQMSQQFSAFLTSIDVTDAPAFAAAMDTAVAANTQLVDSVFGPLFDDCPAFAPFNATPVPSFVLVEKGSTDGVAPPTTAK